MPELILFKERFDTDLTGETKPDPSKVTGAFESLCAEKKCDPKQTIFIFPGNEIHHLAVGIKLFDQMKGAGLAMAARFLSDEKHQYPCLSLPTTFYMLDYRFSGEAQARLAKAALADLWFAIGRGFNIFIPIRKLKSMPGDKYFDQAIVIEDGIEYEPSFWGGVTSKPNPALANIYQVELKNLIDFMKMKDPAKKDAFLKSLDPIYAKAYREGLENQGNFSSFPLSRHFKPPPQLVFGPSIPPPQGQVVLASVPPQDQLVPASAPPQGQVAPASVPPQDQLVPASVPPQGQLVPASASSDVHIGWKILAGLVVGGLAALITYLSGGTLWYYIGTGIAGFFAGTIGIHYITINDVEEYRPPSDPSAQIGVSSLTDSELAKGQLGIQPTPRASAAKSQPDTSNLSTSVPAPPVNSSDHQQPSAAQQTPQPPPQRRRNP